MSDQTCDWVGVSKNTYTYFIHTIPVSFNNDQDGNYIFTKKVDGKWRPIYIGQGDLGDRISANHHKIDCIERKGATHVHVHLNSNKVAREHEEADLLANYTQSYEPTGCNEKIEH